VNIWAIGFDLKVWKKPLEFDLDQFSNFDIKVGGSSYNLLPFGSGHQQCLGLDLAQHMCNMVLQQFFMQLIGLHNQMLNLKT
jgi:cytochrome P450